MIVRRHKQGPARFLFRNEYPTATPEFAPPAFVLLATLRERHPDIYDAIMDAADRTLEARACPAA